MATILGCIADDFTGASDLAGLLARSGVPVSLRIGVPDTAPSETVPFEVIALKCRTVPVDQAVTECLSALKWLQAAGAEHYFWKYCSTFDSTAQGNIGPVAEALMSELGAEQTVYCPAFPENGRSVFMGNLFVGQQPLAESPMKDHPLTPMRDSNLMRLLEPQVTRPVGLADRLAVARGADALRTKLDVLRREGAAHVVVDAVADEDLAVIAEAYHDMPLMTGGSALAMALPALYEAAGLETGRAKDNGARDTGGCGIVLSGSCSAMTQAQVAAYAAKAPHLALDPVELSEQGADKALDWLRQQSFDVPPLIYATAAPEAVKSAQAKLGIARAGAVVEETLAKLAVAARDCGVGRIVVAGGETSGAVTKALGVRQLDVGHEIAPGVPWTFCDSDGKRIALALKSGNFGDELFFSKAFEMLEEEA